MDDKQQKLETEEEMDNEDYVQEIYNYVSEYKKFGLDQHVSRFIIKNLGKDPEKRFKAIIEERIERAYQTCKAEKKIQKCLVLLLMEKVLNGLLQYLLAIDNKIR